MKGANYQDYTIKIVNQPVSLPEMHNRKFRGLRFSVNCSKTRVEMHYAPGRNALCLGLKCTMPAA
jgi:hypothetical protein